jgi:hypothetical protein
MVTFLRSPNRGARFSLTKGVKHTKSDIKEIEKRSERPDIMPTSYFGEFNFLNLAV